jgi:preprotein translocase subunit SecA
LRQGIGLRGYGQRDPLIEYKREAFDLFLGLMDTVRKTYLMTLLKLEPMGATPVAAVVQPQVNLEFRGADESVGQFAGATPSGGSPAAEPIEQKPIVNTSTVNRNDPCPCGSGKKYKRCHGA